MHDTLTPVPQIDDVFVPVTYILSNQFFKRQTYAANSDDLGASDLNELYIFGSIVKKIWREYQTNIPDLVTENHNNFLLAS